MEQLGARPEPQKTADHVQQQFKYDTQPELRAARKAKGAIEVRPKKWIWRDVTSYSVSEVHLAYNGNAY